MSGLDELDPTLAAAGSDLIAYATQAGYNPRLTSGYRSVWKQLELWSRYVAGRSRYPAAPPGYSAHEYGWAFDLAVEPYDALADLGAVWESWGGTWGAARDPIHFELQGSTAYLRTLPPEVIADYWAPGSIAQRQQLLEAILRGLSMAL